MLWNLQFVCHELIFEVHLSVQFHLVFWSCLLTKWLEISCSKKCNRYSSNLYIEICTFFAQLIYARDTMISWSITWSADQLISHDLNTLFSWLAKSLGALISWMATISWSALCHVTRTLISWLACDMSLESWSADWSCDMSLKQWSADWHVTCH